MEERQIIKQETHKVEGGGGCELTLKEKSLLDLKVVAPIFFKAKAINPKRP